MCFIIIGFMLLLRGEEVPLTSVAGMFEYWSNCYWLPLHEWHVMVILQGKFKGADYLRWHYLPLQTSQVVRSPCGVG